MKGFWTCALLRALRTVCQTAISTIAVFSTGEIVGITDINWVLVASASVLAGILSLLTSIATGLPEVEWEHQKYMDIEPPEDAEVDGNDD